MGTIKLTSYGSSLREPVKINGFVLSSVYYQADDIYLLDVISDLTSSDLCFEETSCQGNVYSNGSGRVRVKDISESEYIAYSILFYTNYEGTKKIVAVLTSDKHDYIISKNSDTINKFINLDLSVFQYGVSFSSYVSGSRIATQNSDGILHIDDPNTSIDDSYAVYTKSQVDTLLPTKLSDLENDVGFISDSTGTGVYVTTDTDQLVEGSKTFYSLFIDTDGSFRILYPDDTNSFIMCTSRDVVTTSGDTYSVPDITINLGDSTSYVDGYPISRSLGAATHKLNVSYTDKTVVSISHEGVEIFEGSLRVPYIGDYNNPVNTLYVDSLYSPNSDSGFYKSNGTIDYQNYVSSSSLSTTLSDYVDLSSNQEISGSKTFTSSTLYRQSVTISADDTQSGLSLSPAGSFSLYNQNSNIELSIDDSGSFLITSDSDININNTLCINTSSLLPYADALVDLGSPTNRWRSAYIQNGIYLSDGRVSITGAEDLLLLRTGSSSNDWTNVVIYITDTRFDVGSYIGSTAEDQINHSLISASANGISLYDNYVNITSTKTTFNKDIDLVLAKDTNTYIYNDILGYSSTLEVRLRYDDTGGITGLTLLFGRGDGENTAPWEKFIPLSELDAITPIGECVYTNDGTIISQTVITDSLRSVLIDHGRLEADAILYIDGDIDNPTALGVAYIVYTTYSDNPLVYIIPVSELSLDTYFYQPQEGYGVVFNNNSTYTISNDYICHLAIPVKRLLQEYVSTTSNEIVHSEVNNFATTLDSNYVTLYTAQTITGDKIFNSNITFNSNVTFNSAISSHSNVYITTGGSNLYVTGYDDQSGIRFGDAIDSTSYPMIVGETMSSTRCDLRQNYYVNNTLAGTIQTQCDSDGNLLTTSGLGRSSSTTGKWSLGTSDYRLNAVYADNFHGDLSGNAATATTATTAATATSATTATFSQYIKYSTSTNYPMYASSSTVLRPTVNSSVDIGTSSYKYKNVYADFYNGFPIIPFGTCDSDASADKVVTLSPAPPSLTTGMIICVQFTSTNTKSSPTLNVNGLGAKVMWRTSSDQIGTNIATSWPSGSRVLFRYSGSTWSMISKVDYQTSTASNTNIIPSTDNTYNIGSTDYKWKNLYITGGHSNRHIVIDNNGGEPTIRPDRTNYGYLGSSTYHWYDAYINNVYVGQNEVPLPPISCRANTQLGSIQFLRVAIPANTTTGIKNAGSALSSSTYTLMLVTAATNVSYLSFRNNTAPSGTWTTLTDMYYYNSGTSVIYTYVLAYKSA